MRKIANATSQTRPVDGILIVLKAAAVGLIRRGWVCRSNCEEKLRADAMQRQDSENRLEVSQHTVAFDVRSESAA